MAFKLLSGNSNEALLIHETITLGRPNFLLTHQHAASVSREQCQIVCKWREGTAHITSIGSENPTRVIRAAGGDDVLLHKGESCQLELGDKICLLSIEPAQHFTLARADSAGGGGVMEQPAGPDSTCTVPTCDAVLPVAAASLGGASSANTGPEPARSGLILVLCGAPGSGKSTLSGHLTAANPAWERVNQDTIKSGRRGSRQDCLAAARRIVTQGRYAVIDRCNVESSQRADFLQLAADLGVPAHAVVLDLAAEVCAKQAMARKGHEGGLEGPQSRRVVLSMTGKLRKEGTPSKSEGLLSVIVCTSHKDIAHALEVWKHPPEGSFDPEAAFRSKGGNRGKLQSFFSASPASGTKKAEKILDKQKQVAQPSTAVRSPGPPLKRKVAPPIPAASNMHAAGPPQTPAREGPSALIPGASAQPQKNAFAALMASAKSPKVAKVDPAPARHGSRQWGSFAQELRNVAMNPEREGSKHPGMVVTDDYCIINDKFPKAKLHGLVIARDPSLESPSDLRQNHLPLLQNMQEAGRAWAEGQGHSLQNCKLGFHGIPSMRQLHLHVISQDYDSPCLKNKKHWNSFVTEFFLELPGVRQNLESSGRLDIDESRMKELLASQLRCHRCSAVCKTMPALKAHIATCASQNAGG